MAIKKHLKDACEGYACEIANNIRPISTIDAEFISELIDILDKRGGNKELLSIMKSYKKEDDGRVLDELIQYSMSIDDETGEDGNETGGKGKNLIIDFIQIKNQYFQAQNLFRLRTFEGWEKEVPYWGIIINESPLPQSLNWYTDAKIVWETEEERDKGFESLKDKLKNFRNVRFL